MEYIKTDMKFYVCTRRNSLGNRGTIRKGLTTYKNTELFLYGRMANIKVAKGYCRLHKCYIDFWNLKEKNCIYKNCKYWEEK